MNAMSRHTVFALALVFLVGLTDCRAEEPKRRKEAVVAGNNEFALDLYGKLKGSEGNLFFSPYSISTALAMTYAGARGNTEKQMAETLHFDPDQKTLHAAFSRLQSDVNAVQEKGEIQLHVANALWAQKDYKFLNEFLDVLKSCYEAAVNPLDFKADV